MNLFARATIAWIIILVFAILNGALRQLVLIPRWGEETGHVVSTLALSAVILAVTWMFLPWLRPVSVREAWGIGLLWVGLTLAFEFLAGHYLFGLRWAQLLADYNVLSGRIWILVPVTTLCAPALVHRRHNG